MAGAPEHKCNFTRKVNRATKFHCTVCALESDDSKRYECDTCGQALHYFCNIEQTDDLGDKIEAKVPIGEEKFKFIRSRHLKLKDLIGKNGKKLKYYDEEARHCFVCGRRIEAYLYHLEDEKVNKDIPLNMHPCCAHLIQKKHRITHGNLVYELRDNKVEKDECRFCGSDRPQHLAPYKGRPGWVYANKEDKRKSIIHVSCLLEMTLRLRNNMRAKREDNGRITGYDFEKAQNLQPVPTGGGGKSLSNEIMKDLVKLALEITGGIFGIPTIILDQAFRW